jgi:hypothetical protein
MKWVSAIHMTMFGPQSDDLAERVQKYPILHNLTVTSMRKSRYYCSNYSMILDKCDLVYLRGATGEGGKSDHTLRHETKLEPL